MLVFRVLAGVELQLSLLVLSCPIVMTRLLWAKDQHEVCRYIKASLDKMSLL